MLALLSLAGGVGALSRFLLDTLISRHHDSRIPLGTLVINVAGSLVLGLLTGWVAYGDGGGHDGDLVKAIVGTGFCGGFTTYSTAAVETVRVWQAEGRRPGMGYAVVTMVGSVAAAAIGLIVGGALLA